MSPNVVVHVYVPIILLFLTRVPVYRLNNAHVCSEPCGTNPGRL